MSDKRFDARVPEKTTHVRAHTRTMHDGTIVDVTDYLRRVFTRPGRFDFTINSASISYNDGHKGGGIIDIFVSEDDAIEGENWEDIEQELYTAISEDVPNIVVHEGDDQTITPDGVQFRYFVSEKRPMYLTDNAMGPDYGTYDPP